MDGICATFALCCQLGALCGQKAIKDLPGCWEHQINDDWHLSFNGHAHEVTDTSGYPVPPISIWVRHSRYFASGVVAPFGGMMMGGGEAEDDLIAALEVAIRGLGGTPATEATE